MEVTRTKIRRLKANLTGKGYTNLWADRRFRFKRWIMVVYHDTRFDDYMQEHEYALGIRNKSDALKAVKIFNG